MNVCRLIRLEDVMRRCEVVGDCWLWQESIGHGGGPQMRALGTTVSVRKYVYEYLLGKVVGKSYRLVAKCCDQRCVSPTCIVRRTPGEVLKRQFEAGSRPRRGVGRSFARTIDDSVVEQIRVAVGTHQQIADAHGVSRAMVGAILRGDKRRRVANSVFNWRGQ